MSAPRSRESKWVRTLMLLLLETKQSKKLCVTHMRHSLPSDDKWKSEQK